MLRRPGGVVKFCGWATDAGFCECLQLYVAELGETLLYCLRSWILCEAVFSDPAILLGECRI